MLPVARREHTRQSRAQHGDRPWARVHRCVAGEVVCARRGTNLQVRIEAFNLPNRANFAVPSGRIAFTGVAADGVTPVIAPTWGRITSTVTTSRQIQVGAKVTF